MTKEVVSDGLDAEITLRVASRFFFLNIPRENVKTQNLIPPFGDYDYEKLPGGSAVTIICAATIIRCPVPKFDTPL